MGLTFLVGCAAAPPAGRWTCWAAEDGWEPNPADGEVDDGLFDRSANRIDLTAAINETVAFRWWASCPGASFDEVTIAVDDWQSGEATLPAGAVSIYRVEAVRVSRWRGWQIRSLEPEQRQELVEDVLIPAAAPRGGLPHKMSDGDTLALWVDVNVPKGTRPGVFRSKLRLRCAGEDKASVDLRLEVLPFVLPDQTEVILAADVDIAALFAHHVTYRGEPCRATRVAADSPVRSELQSVLDASMRLLQAHKVTPLLTTLYPVIKIDALNAVSVRWDDYDAAVAGYLDGTKFTERAPLPLWVVPLDERFPTPPAYGAMQSPAYSCHLREYLAQAAEHFAERGWLERSFVEVPYAKFPGAEASQAAQHFAGVIRKADNRLRILSNLFPQDLGPYGWPDFPTADLLGYVDIWCPPAQFYARPAPIGGVAPSEMWMRVDRPPFSGSIELSAPPADTWVLPWQAYREGTHVVRLGLINSWPEPTLANPPSGQVAAQACIDATGSRGEASSPLVYPGTVAGLTEPIPSVRLKRLQRGMLDLAYLKLLREKGLGHIAEVLAESLAPFAGAKACRYHYADPRGGGWVRDPQRWHEARRIMIDELKLAVKEGTVASPARVAANVRWRRFIEAVRRVRVEVEGVRVRREAAGQGKTSVECTVVIHNGKRTPVSGALAFGELPVGWTNRDRPAAVFIPPGDSVRRVLAAEATVVTWDEEGVRYLPITFTAEDGSAQEIAARMSIVAAQPLREGIRIDGDLSDWPPGVANLASDFVLITGEPPDGSRASTSRPKSATRVYAVADAEAVYFAFDCVTEEATPALPAHTNAVQYDDLIPLGDERVEIVLDPSGAGTHSTSDLYHVIIGPAGVLWERGIGTDPPTGLRRVWTADLRYAVRTCAERWVAEVRIPLKAFDAGPVGGRIWAINFSRFDLKRQEYSNWAGAAGNFYDPAALGNLALP